MDPDRTPVPPAEIAAALARVEAIEPPAEPERIESPRDTKGWKLGRQDGIETFAHPDGRVFTRCIGDEDADVIVVFTGPRSRGMTPMRLVLAEFSYALKGAATRRRRKQRELRARGYDVA